ncbi:MAG: site-specific DNA-methyltransferase [Ignavibacteriales bacterium]|nr:site-specific DNA-methyltransferase [Ignavibacteriales bacterium]MCF8305874.1 site-specific DNA-methyltransferase [Ignavibacteriales bacterium]MCF8315596.1 site-specific DNA-methyltransferase [Ignavibacteriales bacterium]MCF8437211.1 site-specific DNA-methyltransferase [Ignavibacteriales bacterium]
MVDELFDFKQASEFASKYINKEVSISNISYLVQYGRVPKVGNNGNLSIRKSDLQAYYDTNHSPKAEKWREKLGDDLNWHLSFSDYRESETTKHVHRLHPYKGKFIPQLVEYFLDNHTDEFKQEVFFQPGDIVLDPFCGSGTTLVQANELGINAVGIDVSAFNTLISNAKIGIYDLQDVYLEAKSITNELYEFQEHKNNVEFENRLLEELKKYNDQYFPSPDYRYKVRNNEIDEKSYGAHHEKEFLSIYNKLISKYKIELLQKNNSTFIEKWYLQVIRDEIDFVFEQLKSVKNPKTKVILSIVLSRTIRSCRATTHADLATLFEPVVSTYYCKKHGKICKPLFTIANWWNRYYRDTIERISEFQKIRTDTFQKCLTGDSRTIDIADSMKKKNPDFYGLIEKQKIKGIFSSPPYVGLIDYHEQHAYAYDLFGFERNDDEEIGRLFRGQGREARDSYVAGISEVLLNSKNYLSNDYDVFLVANDKFGLYESIAGKSGMKIVNRYKRPVLNRVEKDRSAYSETIFHLKEKS